MPKKPKIFVKTEPMKVKKAVKDYVKKAIAVATETKVAQYLVEAKAVAFASPVVTNLTAIASGDDQNDRNGNKIDVVNLQGRIEVRCANNATTVAPFPIRCIVVRDKSNTGSIPAITDIYPLMTNGGVVATSMTGVYSDDKSELKERFTILYDKIKYMSNINATEYSDAIKHFRLSKKLNSKVYFNGPLSTDESKNAIISYILVGTTSNNVVAEATFRTYFKDA